MKCTQVQRLKDIAQPFKGQAAGMQGFSCQERAVGSVGSAARKLREKAQAEKEGAKLSFAVSLHPSSW